MTFRFAQTPPPGLVAWLAGGLRNSLEAAGYRQAAEDESPGLVIQCLDLERIRPYRRRSQATFVAGIVVLPEPPDDALRAGYPLLVRSLSNLLILAAQHEGTVVTWFLTPERGAYAIPSGPSDDAFFARMRDRLMPLAGSHLVVDNIFDPDLPRSLWNGCPETESMIAAGRRLDALGVLPAPFPIREILPPRDMRLVERLYSLGGLSYGNLSVRAPEGGFWMSGSGVDKSNLRTVGRDFLLVKDFDTERNAMRLSVPPHVTPNRVSVDAIEHWMIYREHPQVGAIMHVHAWLDGATLTPINYPCGSLELAQTVAATVRRAPDPAHAVVGLVNHGLTITGPSLEEIFDRVESRLQAQVPMV